MTTQTVTQLTEGDGSRIYRSRAGKSKHATLYWGAADYEVPWGSQSFPGPHMRIHDASGDYGVELETFFTTHRPAIEQDHYVKVSEVRALQVHEPTEVVTLVKGRQESTASVQPGGWIIQNPEGEVYATTADEFEKRYELRE